MEFIITIQEPEIQLITVASQGEQGIAGLIWIDAGWASGVDYVVNNALEHNGSSYRVFVAHTSSAATEPGIGVDWETVWKILALEGVPGTTVHNDTTGKQGGGAGEFFHSTADQNAAQENANAPREMNPFSTDQDLIARDSYRQSLSLISGQSLESFGVVNGVASADLVNFIVGTQGVKLTTTGAVTATMLIDPPGAEDPIVISPAPAVIGMAFYVPDASKVSLVSILLHKSADLTSQWTRSSANFPDPIKDGWNYMRFSATEGNTDDWGTIYRTRMLIVTTDATSVTFGRVWAESNSKAQILFIEDGGYKTFLDVGYPDLVARGVPVTWAIDPLKLGTGTGDAQRVTEADIAVVANDGNFNSISFHGFNGDPTIAMTPDEIVEDTVNSIKWLAARGYAGRMWRAAWVQNEAANASAVDSMLLGAATNSSDSSLTVWPPKDRYNIPRSSVHGSSQAVMDAFFAGLELTHGLFVVYTHGVTPTGSSNDASQAQWDYFLSKIDAGIAGGWLEAVIFESLFSKSGGRFIEGMGYTKAEFLDEAGDMQRVLLP